MKLGIVSPSRTSSGGAAFAIGIVPALNARLDHPVTSTEVAPLGKFHPSPELATCSHIIFAGARAERVQGAKTIFWPLNVAPLEKHAAYAHPSTLKHRLRHVALMHRLRHSVRAVDGMVFSSMHARTLYQAAFPAAATKQYLLLKGSAPSMAPVQRANCADPLILLVSHLYPYKGILQFVEAAAIAAGRLPESVRFRVAGDNRDVHYARAVRQRISELGMDQRIEIRPAGREELSRLYSEATICVFTSTCENAGSYALFDGLYAGVPTICSDRSSMPEIVGEAVRLVNPYAPQDLADEILSLMSDEHARAELSTASLRWAASALTWEERAGQVIEFIERLR